MSDYASRRRRFQRVLTIYGRKPVLEALGDHALDCERLHLADSNREDGTLRRLLELAAARGIETRRHSRQALARISRNGRQDQGVALDIRCPRFATLDDGLAALAAQGRSHLLCLDGVTNPQNMGMAIRSARAGGMEGILYADRGNPALGPLVIKASAGTLYGAPLLRCETLPEALRACLTAGYTLYTLEAGASDGLFDTALAPHAVFVLGGETDGVSADSRSLPHTPLAIPMAAGVESLNVAVSAALVAYAGALGSAAAVTATGSSSPLPAP